MEDIYESGEMYLETILLLKKSKGAVRSIDIVNDLNNAKSSVSRGNILKSKGFITVAEDGAIEFTETGRERAQEIYERHKILTAFLKKLGVSEKTAEADACRMEHVISQESFEVIKKQL
ncbi:MAG: metal-dependent transcriptional regulator [Eubacteriales bacterium]